MRQLKNQQIFCLISGFTAYVAPKLVAIYTLYNTASTGFKLDPRITGLIGCLKAIT